jgi:YHS domain-containing protein
MTDVNALINRIDQEVAAEVGRQKADWAEMVQANREHRVRLQRYETDAKDVIDLLKPRLTAFTDRFKAVVKAEPIVREHTRAFNLRFVASLAKVTLLFEVLPDRDVNHIRLECTQEIIPVVVRYDKQPVLEFPLGGVRDDAVVQWFDDRIVAFVKAYIAVMRLDAALREQVKDVLVEDPVAKIRFPKHLASSTLERDGWTYHFVDEDTRREFEKQPAAASKVDEFRDLRQNPTSALVLGAVLVFFVLAGLYEGWSLPLAVILVVPMCVLCALAGVAVRGQDNNLFTQIGFVVLIGLACKNAILIVEFARDRQLEGASVFDAAVQAALARLRPIVMTTFCFIHMVPPYFASGAGAEMRRSVGSAMLWGAFRVTLFGIFLTPVFFYVIRRLVGGRTPTREPAAALADRSSRAYGVATAVVPASSNGELGT